MKQRRFKSAADVSRWLKEIQGRVAWEDNTTTAPTFVEMKPSYPVTLKLPKPIRLWGRVDAVIVLPADLVMADPLKWWRALSDCTDTKREFSLTFQYSLEKKKWPAQIGIALGPDGLRLTFQADYAFKEVDKGRQLFSALIAAFELNASIQKVTELKPQWSSKSFSVSELSMGEITEGFTLISDPAEDLKLEYVNLNVYGANPREVSTACRLKPKEALSRMIDLIRRSNWFTYKARLHLSDRADVTTRKPQRAWDCLAALNAAKFPCRKVELLELWYNLESWRDFPALSRIAVMDVEKSPAEINILRVDLGNGMKGFISVAATAKTYTVEAFPIDEIANDDAAQGQFYAEWKKMLNAKT